MHTNRVLNALRAKGLITLKSNTLTIGAWAELVQAGEFDPAYLHLRKQAAG